MRGPSSICAFHVPLITYLALSALPNRPRIASNPCPFSSSHWPWRGCLHPRSHHVHSSFLPPSKQSLLNAHSVIRVIPPPPHLQLLPSPRVHGRRRGSGEAVEENTRLASSAQQERNDVRQSSVGVTTEPLLCSDKERDVRQQQAISRCS